MHLLRRSHHEDPEIDDENAAIDPELRLRTVRTAHSTIEESIRTEERARRRKTLMRARSRPFFRRGSDKKRAAKNETVKEPNAELVAAPLVTGFRRNIYVNKGLSPDELDANGEPLVRYFRNKVRTSSEYHDIYIRLFRTRAKDM